ncbi:MAG: hypothetical protein ACRDL6_07965 [Solirubrobacterales bacterium]
MTPIGLGRKRRRAVSLEEGAAPGAARCPACGEPFFVWVETEGFGPREDQLVDRCENCGLVATRDAVPSPEQAASELLGAPSGNGDGSLRGTGREVMIRVRNAASLQAWLGAENWAALRPGESSIKPTPRAAELLLARRGLEVRRIRPLPGAGIASMWQTLLNLLTFHRDFATEACSGRLRPGAGRGLAAYLIDAVVTVLAAVPTAILAVLLEGGATLARRGGVIELKIGPAEGR